MVGIKIYAAVGICWARPFGWLAFFFFFFFFFFFLLLCYSSFSACIFSLLSLSRRSLLRNIRPTKTNGVIKKLRKGKETDPGAIHVVHDKSYNLRWFLLFHLVERLYRCVNVVVHRHGFGNANLFPQRPV
jgi:hypothetical protein